MHHWEGCNVLFIYHLHDHILCMHYSNYLMPSRLLSPVCYIPEQLPWSVGEWRYFGGVGFVFLFSPQHEGLWKLPVSQLKCYWLWSFLRNFDTPPALHSSYSGLQTQRHMEPMYGNIRIISKWECDSFLLIAENCCCIWLRKVQFCRSGWMLKRKNRGRDSTDNSKNGRWSFALYMRGLSNLIITEHAVHVL